MPINLNELRNNLYTVNQTASKMISLVDAAMTAKFIVDTIEITFTAEQKQALIDRYIVLRNELKTAVNALP